MDPPERLDITGIPDKPRTPSPTSPSIKKGELQGRSISPQKSGELESSRSTSPSPSPSTPSPPLEGSGKVVKLQRSYRVRDFRAIEGANEVAPPKPLGPIFKAEINEYLRAAENRRLVEEYGERVKNGKPIGDPTVYKEAQLALAQSFKLHSVLEVSQLIGVLLNGIKATLAALLKSGQAEEAAKILNQTDLSSQIGSGKNDVTVLINKLLTLKSIQYLQLIPYLIAGKVPFREDSVAALFVREIHFKGIGEPIAEAIKEIAKDAPDEMAFSVRILQKLIVLLKNHKEGFEKQSDLLERLIKEGVTPSKPLKNLINQNLIPFYRLLKEAYSKGVPQNEGAHMANFFLLRVVNSLLLANGVSFKVCKILQQEVNHKPNERNPRLAPLIDQLANQLASFSS